MYIYIYIYIYVTYIHIRYQTAFNTFTYTKIAIKNELKIHTKTRP